MDHQELCERRRRFESPHLSICKMCNNFYELFELIIASQIKICLCQQISLVAGDSMSKSTYKWMTVQSVNLINVSITRARKKIYIIGNRENIDSRTGILSDLGQWVDFCNEKYLNNSNSSNTNTTSQ